MTRLAWVVGSRGLLGAAVVRSVTRRSDWRLWPGESLPWTDADGFATAVRDNARTLIRDASESGEPWSVVWAAGAAFTSSTQEALDAELEQFTLFLGILAEEAAGAAQPGTFFLASSGGGIYAGASNPPFTELTPPAPLAPYGHFKVRMEEAVTSFAASSGIRVLIGRITNLYGPGQRLDKMQGLITHLALARYGTKPAFIFVPLETVRDYIYVDDCAMLILDGLDRLSTEALPADAAPAITKILGSGQGVSISTLLGYYRGITKAGPRVVHGTSPSTKHQAIDLRMKSVVWPELDARDQMPVAAGFSAVMQDVLRMLQK
ncbi:NAD-dependent epimerase/dehydratase family protein [Glaciihabitans sp. dw_435]|uniref:NAD-dependent epimerase/dehydratase family protein n=1 Tax=Glaciihabitans sp. dw_435 TaxID=2720081 RepID=UPI001BD68FD5|nr:NAD-dependent epimerase/dehydratase family protein [Glaciihabitans sp. dw_435]